MCLYWYWQGKFLKGISTISKENCRLNQINMNSIFRNFTFYASCIVCLSSRVLHIQLVTKTQAYSLVA